MAKISRVFQSIFGSNAPDSGAGSITQFGSFAAGSTTQSTSVSVIQGLAAWANGWISAIIGQNGPTIEDMNAVFYVITTQLAYLFQAGVPEWNTSTIYYTGSLVNVLGITYQSLSDANQGNATTNTTYWAPLNGRYYAASSGYTAQVFDDVIGCSAAGGAFALTIPLSSTMPGKYLTVVQLDTSANAVTISPSGSDTLGNQASLQLTYDGVTQASYTLYSTGTGWLTV